MSYDRFGQIALQGENIAQLAAEAFGQMCSTVFGVNQLGGSPGAASRASQIGAPTALGNPPIGRKCQFRASAVQGAGVNGAIDAIGRSTGA